MRADVAAAEADLVAAPGQAHHHLAAPQLARQVGVEVSCTATLVLGIFWNALTSISPSFGPWLDAWNALCPTAARRQATPDKAEARRWRRRIGDGHDGPFRRRAGASRARRVSIRFSDSKCRTACCITPAIWLAVCSTSVASILLTAARSASKAPAPWPRARGSRDRRRPGADGRPGDDHAVVAGNRMSLSPSAHMRSPSSFDSATPEYSSS